MAADKEVQAGEARRDFSPLLDEVEHHGAHVEVRRYRILPPIMSRPPGTRAQSGARGQRRA